MDDIWISIISNRKKEYGKQQIKFGMKFSFKKMLKT
jgi:hypothetical protein